MEQPVQQIKNVTDRFKEQEGDSIAEKAGVIEEL